MCVCHVVSLAFELGLQDRLGMAERAIAVHGKEPWVAAILALILGSAHEAAAERKECHRLVAQLLLLHRDTKGASSPDQVAKSIGFQFKSFGVAAALSVVDLRIN